jgi:PAS domain S-box-containing protein
LRELITFLYENPKLFVDILDSIKDAIYISDSNGNTLWLNKASERMCRLPKDKIIGKNVKDLEKQGIYSPSVTRMALELNKNVSTVQIVNEGRKYIATGHLVKDEEGKVIVTVAHSRDITEAVKNTTKLHETEGLLKKYSEEIRKQSTIAIKQKSSYWKRKSKSYENAEKLMPKIANVDTTVMIIGETGTGKSMTAEKIHLLSKRKSGPFVQINCASLPESLLESELFGYEKGSFTGAASQGKSGLIQAAERGTLFLDEIGELPSYLQAKLLYFVQAKQYLPIGARKYQQADVRIITATNQNLDDMVAKGTFRSDLLHRLNVLTVKLPPLRESLEDIEELAQHFLHIFNQKYDVKKTFSKEVLNAFYKHSWPGNVRELENLIERLVILSDEQITEEDLNQHLVQQNSGISVFHAKNFSSMTNLLEETEQNLIVDALEKYKSTRKAAKFLGVTQSLLMRRVKKYNIRIAEENETKMED